MVISAKDFSNREELETHIAVVSEQTTDPKPDLSIVGTDAELRKLNLSHGKKCWGITATATDSGEIQKGSFERVERGKITPAPKAESVDIKKSKER